MSALLGGPCASWRVVRWIEGLEADVRWCERIDGPCPFPATDLSGDHGVGIECGHDIQTQPSPAASSPEVDR